MAESKLKAAALWKKTSATGNIYLVGRLGGVRVLVFENRDRKGAPVCSRTRPKGNDMKNDTSVFIVGGGRWD